MFFFRQCLFFFFVVVCSQSVLAETALFPEKGSVLRGTLLNSLRTLLEKELKQKIEFRVSSLKVVGKWALLQGEPLQAKTLKQPNWKGTPLWEQFKSGAFDNNVFALFRKEGEVWKVYRHLIGCTDVCWLSWIGKFNTPKTLFQAPFGPLQIESLKWGSPLRKILIQLLRKPVEKELKQRVIFRVDSLQLSPFWAFLKGAPLNKKTKKAPDYRNTTYWEQAKSGVMDHNVFALFHKEKGQWKVVTYSMGCSDVCYGGWASRFKAPKPLFQ